MSKMLVFVVINEAFVVAVEPSGLDVKLARNLLIVAVVDDALFESFESVDEADTVVFAVATMRFTDDGILADWLEDESLALIVLVEPSTSDSDVLDTFTMTIPSRILSALKPEAIFEFGYHEMFDYFVFFFKEETKK